jgi:transposase
MSRSFAWLYSKEGRPSVPPEQLLSALLIQVLYGVRSERQRPPAQSCRRSFLCSGSAEQ